MRRLGLLLLAVSLCAGCASGRPGEKGNFIQNFYSSESRKLASARTLIEKGDNAGAAKILESITNATPVTGVTDEALFRLALITLKPTAERPASPQAHQLLRRLKKDYPSSVWSVQSTPLLELINSADELRRQNRTYRASNQSLNKEVGELNKTINDLNKNIDQLKHLDLEIEKKTR